MFDPYIRPDARPLEKIKNNNGKDISYPPIPYAYPYPPFAPPLHTPENTESFKKSNMMGNGNINFSLYPPYGSDRYPHPYMDYHYQPVRDNSANPA